MDLAPSRYVDLHAVLLSQIQEWLIAASPCKWIKRLKQLLVDPGMLIYHPLPTITALRTFFKQYSYRACIYCRDWYTSSRVEEEGAQSCPCGNAVGARTHAVGEL